MADEHDAHDDDVAFEAISPDTGITQIESMCVNCERNGMTRYAARPPALALAPHSPPHLHRFMLTKIPFFREIIISYFECKNCGFRNNTIDSAGRIQDQGVRLSVRCKGSIDLNRTIVKSDSASVRVPELDLEIPPNTQKGQVNTIEGVLSATYDGLNEHQEQRREVDAAAAVKIDAFLANLQSCLKAEKPFVFILDDPAGNSFIQNPLAPKEDPEMIELHYTRTTEQNESLGISDEEVAREELRKQKEQEGFKWLEEKERMDTMREKPADFVGIQSYAEPGDEFSRPAGSRFSVLRSTNSIKELTTAMSAEDIEKDVVTFTVPCAQCSQDAAQRMVKINIPYFKEVIVMALVCPHCSYKNSEIKVGGAISEKGRKLSLHVLKAEDLSRDILKSETATLSIPELDFTLNQYGSMGGRFTTVEGLITTIRKELSENPFAVGDSGERSAKDNFKYFLERLDHFATAKEPFTIVLDDPVANSYVQNLHTPDPDPQLEVEDYTRTHEQDDDLGLTNMKTEGYEEDATTTASS